MSLRTFFEYPTEIAAEQEDALLFLPQWTEEQWRKLSTYTGKLRLSPGDDLIRMGESDRSFYIVTAGQFEILIPRKGSRQLQRTQIREAGTVVGEQAFIDGKSRSATVRALTTAEVLRINPTAFEVLSAREPDLARDILLDLARLLSIKLRQANTFIANWVK